LCVYRPVSKDAREGVQTGLLQYAFVNRTADRPSESRLGVRATVLPAMPMASRRCWSDMRSSTFFGRAEEVGWYARTTGAVRAAVAILRNCLRVVSECKFQGHLHDAGRRGSADLPGLRVADRRVGIAEIGMI
jgi:hypothetical protein